VTGDVRFGDRVFSPMVPYGEADYLLVLEPTQVETHRHWLRASGTLITPAAVEVEKLPHKKTLNVALLGALSSHLLLPEDQWLSALHDGFEETFFEANRKAFLFGRASQTHERPAALV
jgi:indolepyruvate ferredoxin oxidoreductase beta subunit